MPDFLEKLHMATLKAKNMEIKVKDISSKPLETSSEAKATPSLSGKMRVVVALPGSSMLEGLWDKKGQATSSPVLVPFLLQNGNTY